MSGIDFVKTMANCVAHGFNYSGREAGSSSSRAVTGPIPIGERLRSPRTGL